MRVVATAGHVDHGKSTLLKALTGCNPDRTAEEMRRNLSIELGYVWTTLDGIGDVAFVDVPGHERFFATTLSALCVAPSVLLVVAADDGWNVQTSEHVDALSALGVTEGVLVISRSDLQDPSVTLDSARERLGTTTLADIPAVCVCATTGAGIVELRHTLARVLRRSPPAPLNDHVRMWIDRKFQIRGAGTIITGTLEFGAVQRSQELVLGDHGKPFRIRGVQALGKPTESAQGVARVALNVAGTLPTRLGRGTVVTTPDAFLAVRDADVRVGYGQADQIPREPTLHIGSTHQAVHARHLGGQFYRLRLSETLPLRIGDRAILRSPGDRRMWGIYVADPLPPPLVRRGDAKRRSEALLDLDGSARAYIGLAGAVRTRDLVRMGFAAEELNMTGLTNISRWTMSDAFRDNVREFIGDPMRATEHVPGAMEAARRARLLDPSLVMALKGDWLRSETERADDGFSSQTVPALKSTLGWLWSNNPCDVPARPLMDAVGSKAELDAAIQILASVGDVAVAPDGSPLSPDVEAIALAELALLEQPFSVSSARAILQVSRRATLIILDYLESRDLVQRHANDLRSVAMSDGPEALT